MSKITAPYNFVPLSDIVFYPQWTDKISQDIPFEDGEDGIIELEITNKSPLFIGESNLDHFSAHICVGDQRRYYIPGTTLKGCFRNVMEILSYAKMEQFEDDSFGFRTFDKKVKDSYTNLVKNVQCGWLWKDSEGKCYLEECVKGIQRIKRTDMEQRGWSEADGFREVSVPEDGVFEFNKNRKEEAVEEGTYRLVCTGLMDGKEHEYLFSTNLKEREEVPKRVIEQFEKVHKRTPRFEVKKQSKGIIRELYDNGDKIPVFFIRRGSEISCIGLTQMLKYPYDYSVKDLVKRNYGEESWKDFEKKQDLPECVFGYIGKTSLKGRVQIGNAFANKSIPDEDLQVVKGVLAQPKSSYYPLYLKQDGTTVENYSSSSTTIAGRKRYRIAKDFQILTPSQGNDNENAMSTFKPLPSGLVFHAKVVFHNLKKVEIGALLSSITFNQTGGCFHNIGMGKSYGFGTIECRIKSLQGLKCSVSEYIDSFDATIQRFLFDHGRSMSSEEVFSRLVSIASPTHSLEEMKQMNVDECALYKEEENASLLEETPKQFATNLTEVGVIKADAQLEASNKNWEGAIKLLDKLTIKLTSQRKDSSEIKELVEQYRADQIRYEDAMKQQELAQKAEEENLREQEELRRREADRISRQEKGLSFLLDRKVNSEELKINSLSQGISRIRDFFKKNKAYTLTVEDSNLVRQWFDLLAEPTKKQDKKQYEEFRSQSLGRIEDVLQEWYNDATKK